jgi:hypothetical protein
MSPGLLMALRRALLHRRGPRAGCGPEVAALFSGDAAGRLECAISLRVTLGASGASPSATMRMAVSSSSRARLLSAKPRARLRCGCAYGHMRGVTVVRIRERAEQAKAVNFYLPLDP